MLRRTILSPAALLASALPLLPLAACASTADHGAAAPAAVAAEEAPDEAADEHALQRAEHELALARARLEVTELEQAAAELRRAAALAASRLELALAERELTHFSEIERPARLEEARLDLQSARDRAQEAADELAQIELMYADQDLDDRTAEFVVSRGRRNAERAAARIAIQEQRLAGLESHELTIQADRLGGAVEEKRAALADLELQHQIAAKQDRIAREEAEQAIEDAEREVDEARAGAGSEG